MDAHTGLSDGREAQEWLAEAIQRAHADGSPLSVALLDVDGLKSANDDHGVEFGNAVLRHLGKLVKESVGTRDLGARVGGDEFLISRVGEDEADAVHQAEQLRTRFAGERFPTSDASFTISVGVVELGNLRPSVTEHAAALLAAADDALDAARGGGGDSVRVYRA